MNDHVDPIIAQALETIVGETEMDGTYSAETVVESIRCIATAALSKARGETPVSATETRAVKWAMHCRLRAKAHLAQARAYEAAAEAESINPTFTSPTARDRQIDHLLELAEDYRQMAEQARATAAEWEQMEPEDTEIRRAG